MKNWVQLTQGYQFDLDNIESNKNINILMLAHNLSNQCRWGGNTIFHYSVAQHLCLCYDKAVETGLNPYLCYEALLHDIAEGVILDMPRPYKKILPDYSALNERIEKFIGNEFGFPYVMSPEVREIDDRMMVTEYNALIDVFDPKVEAFKDTPLKPYDDVVFRPYSQEVIKYKFMSKYYEIMSIIRVKNRK